MSLKKVTRALDCDKLNTEICHTSGDVAHVSASARGNSMLCPLVLTWMLMLACYILCLIQITSAGIYKVYRQSM